MFPVTHLSTPRFASGLFSVSVVEVRIENSPRRTSIGALIVGLVVVRKTAFVSFNTMPAAVTDVFKLTV